MVARKVVEVLLHAFYVRLRCDLRWYSEVCVLLLLRWAPFQLRLMHPISLLHYVVLHRLLSLFRPNMRVVCQTLATELILVVFRATLIAARFLLSSTARHIVVRKIFFLFVQYRHSA